MRAACDFARSGAILATVDALAMHRNVTEIERKLLQTWGRQRRFCHTQGVCHAALWIVGLFLLDLVLDWSFELPGWARLGLVFGNLAILLWIGYQRWWRWLRRYDALRMALEVERLHPNLRSLLVSYVQLQPGREEPATASPQLIAALRSEAVQTTGPLNFLAVVDFGKLRRLLAGTAAVLVGFALSGPFLGEFYTVLWARLVDPQSELIYPTRTQIVAVSGDQTVQQGTAVQLSVAAGGEIPEQATLQIRFGNGPWEKVRLPGDGRGQFVYNLSECGNSFLYGFRVGDAMSKWYRVEVVPAPQIVESLVDIRFPSYSKLPEQQLKALNLEVLEGAEMTWQVRCDQPLAGGEMLCDPGSAQPMTIDPDDPHVARATMTATASLAYQFLWTERGHGYHYADGMRYSLRVMPDEPPFVEILPPLPEEKGTLNKTLTVRFRARDNFGLGEAWIVYSINGEPEQERAAGSLGPERSAVRQVQWRVRDSVSALRENDVLTYAVRVFDNHSGDRGPNAGRSKSLRFHFLSREEYLHYVQETKDELFARVKGVQEEETDSSSTIKSLKAEVKP
jgi:hypothetical protein